MKAALQICLFTYFICCIRGEFLSIKTKGCKNTSPNFKITGVAIKGATLKDDKDGQLLVFKADSNPTMRINFISELSTSERLKVDITAKFGKSYLKWTVPSPKIEEEITHPLVANSPAKYEQKFHLKPEYPQGQIFRVGWELMRSSATSREICFTFRAIIEA